MIILDTNVLLETVKPNPDPKVLEWLAAQNYHDVYLAAMTVAEMLHGVSRMPEGKRRTQLHAAIDAMFRHEFSGRILPFDEAAAMSYAELVTARERGGRSVGAFDAQIAAIAKVHSATVATRNIKYFELTGVTLVNPWSA